MSESAASKHTRTPWQIEPEFPTEIHAGRLIAKAEKAEDAEFIIKAVNSHYALVKALRHCERISDELAAMISKAEYEGDELEKGIDAWDPVANTMRNGFMASFHGIITEALDSVESSEPAPGGTGHQTQA